MYKIKIDEMLSTFVISSMWIVNLIDPLGFFNLKYIAYVALICLSAPMLFMRINKMSKFHLSFMFYFVLFLPIYGIYRMVFASGGQVFRLNDTSYILSSFILLFTLFIFNEKTFKLNMYMLKLTLYTLSFLIVIIAIFSTHGYIVNFTQLFMESGMLFMSTRNYGGVVTPYIYFIISPMLVLLLTSNVWGFLKEKTLINVSKILLVAFSMALSGTRMSLMMVFMSLLFTPLWFYRKSHFSFILYSIPILILISIIFFVGFLEIDYFTEAFSMSEPSNFKKINDMSILLDIFNNPVFFFFGQGFNAYDWSPLADELIKDTGTKIELTYFEFVRVFGIINFIVFVSFLVRVLKVKAQDELNFGWLSPALILYLLASATNPYLFSLNGMLAVATCMSLKFQQGKVRGMGNMR